MVITFPCRVCGGLLTCHESDAGLLKVCNRCQGRTGCPRVTQADDGPAGALHVGPDTVQWTGVGWITPGGVGDGSSGGAQGVGGAGERVTG